MLCQVLPLHLTGATAAVSQPKWMNGQKLAYIQLYSYIALGMTHMMIMAKSSSAFDKYSQHDTLDIMSQPDPKVHYTKAWSSADGPSAHSRAPPAPTLPETPHSSGGHSHIGAPGPSMMELWKSARPPVLSSCCHNIMVLDTIPNTVLAECRPYKCATGIGSRCTTTE